jgi:D-glycero-D-manno-heptose 1,7-bisphosphate phosphatase
MGKTTSIEALSLPLFWMKNPPKSTDLLPIVFFDRDDTLIRDCGQTNDISMFSFTSQAIDVLNSLKNFPIQIGIATNQAGLSNGKFSFDRLNEFMEYLMTQIQVVVGDKSIIVLACHHNSETGCDCRKPKPGLFKFAQTSNLGIPIVFFGNSDSDIKAADAFGIEGILVTESNFAQSVENWIGRTF